MAVNLWKVSLFLCVMVGLSLSTGSAQSQTPTFQPKADYPVGVGSRPYAVAVGDLNNDGYPDIVAASSGSNSISVFLNNGDGTFAAPVSYRVGNSPRSLIIADLNGDGKLDVAAANYIASTVGVLLGNGDGTFQAVTPYSVGGQPTAIAVGDIDNDGLPDLVTAGGAGILSILKNNGGGTFQPAVNIPSDATTGLVLADFDNDGNLDIASVSNAALTERITVRYGLGNGTFPRIDYLPLPVGGGFAIRAADVNLDNFLDLVTSNTGNGLLGSYSYRQGSSTGPLPSGSDTLLGFLPVAVEIADLNGDGFPDLIFANSAQSEIEIAAGNGNGSFQNVLSFSTGSQTYSVAVGDFNRDGKPDIVTANFGANSISVLLNTTPFATRTVSGRIVLEANASSAFPLTFQFRPLNGTSSFVRTVTPAPNGDYTITNLPPKNYNVGIKGAKWLQKSIIANTLVGNVTGFDTTLPSGDGNNDNAVDIADLTLLVSHYNQDQGSGGYLEAVDFNSDGVCDIVDLNLLITNYNRVGDP